MQPGEDHASGTGLQLPPYNCLLRNMVSCPSIQTLIDPLFDEGAVPREDEAIRKGECPYFLASET
jgi:hypothetical protein